MVVGGSTGDVAVEWKTEVRWVGETVRVGEGTFVGGVAIGVGEVTRVGLLNCGMAGLVGATRAAVGDVNIGTTVTWANAHEAATRARIVFVVCILSANQVPSQIFSRGACERIQDEGEIPKQSYMYSDALASDDSQMSSMKKQGDRPVGCVILSAIKPSRQAPYWKYSESKPWAGVNHGDDLSYAGKFARYSG